MSDPTSSHAPRLSRRRAISILASAGAALPAALAAQERPAVQRWRGHALGAEVSLELHGATAADLAAARASLERFEARFSLYRPTSELSQINSRGRLDLSPEMADLLALCDQMHRATDGLFDPTIQPVFRALLEGTAPPWSLVGWDKLQLRDGGVTLSPGQALSLNGIAQGQATDNLRALLHRRGLTQALVAVGEHAALGGPYRLALQDPVFGMVGQRSLRDGALATSSPGAMALGAHHHILHPKQGQARWSTVSVEAPSAAVADALSTAMCLTSRGHIAEIAERLGVRVTLVDTAGDVSRVG